MSKFFTTEAETSYIKIMLNSRNLIHPRMTYLKLKIRIDICNKLPNVWDES